jgi:hypothetical protein
MARQGMNRIHFAVMGRDDLSIEGIQQLNSIRDDDCPMNWHGVFFNFSSRRISYTKANV